MNPLAAVALQLETLGPWGPVAFIALYVLGSIAFVPGALLTLAAGAVFGLWRGALIVFTGAVLGSSSAFAIARTLGRERVTAWIARDERMAAVGRAVAGKGVTVVLLLRLSPIFPYNVLNYALGLSGIRYRDFLMGSIGMLPGTFLYTYYGKVVGDVAAVVAGPPPPPGRWAYGVAGGELGARRAASTA